MSFSFLPSIFVPLFCLIFPLVSLRAFFIYLDKSIID
uniref:Photosystem I reaction center subunit VIII n=1 Tax=Trachelomonas grandis TaxID=215769 RepID=A0A385UK69_9EUGL|nr:photosystem I 4 kDa hydrophobic subunit [Trachelomonas grandis]